jgi:hypothetical protein
MTGKDKIRILGAALVAVGLSGQPSSAQPDDADAGFVGSWMGTATATSVPLPPLTTMLTFTRDGNVLEGHRPFLPANLSPIGPLVLSPGHGAWIRTGLHEFAVTIKIIYEGTADNPASAGQVAALETVRFKIAYDPRTDTLSGNLLDDIRDPSGNPIFSGPGTFSATRIVVDPLP